MQSVSIIIATYNGEKYIIEQLRSILSQTVMPDEVLIYDDHSSDSTPKIIKNFIKQNGLVNWSLVENEENLGWKKNFMRGINAAKGDVIFCCDQDDVWFDNKIETMMQVMENNSEIQVLGCSFIPLFETSCSSINRTITKLEEKSVNTKSHITKISFDRNWLEVTKQGCMSCFKRGLVPYINAVWWDESGHDAAIWCVGILFNCAYTVNVPLMYFRRHGNNSTSNTQHSRNGRIKALYLMRKRLSIVYENKDFFDVKKEQLQTIEELHSFYSDRISAISEQSVKKLLLLLRYMKLYPSKKTWLLDSLATFRK